ncbi:hypothetical protein [Ideonella sp. B508-1]|uniref:hypothetical protein n=1 Tax=Ideonella sp. B508-1 TaxID=137716 RepID=UPI0003B63431|nr:hypothetical protein [Ideonella sp. B508-1]
MPTTTNAATEVFDFADKLALISSEVLHYRIRNRPRLTPKERTALEDLEEKLDAATAKARAEGISQIGKLTSAAKASVEEATKNAENVLKRIKRIERALGIATAVLNLALAISAGQLQGVVAAVNGLEDVVSGDAG